MSLQFKGEVVSREIYLEVVNYRYYLQVSTDIKEECEHITHYKSEMNEYINELYWLWIQLAEWNE